MTAAKELRPCPFCGKDPYVDIMGQIFCNNKPIERHGEGCRIFCKSDLFGWNQAYCWTLVDRLRASLEKIAGMECCHFKADKGEPLEECPINIARAALTPSEASEEKKWKN